MDINRTLESIVNNSIEESVKAHLDMLKELCTDEKIRECEAELAAFTKSTKDEIAKVEAEYDLEALRIKEKNHTLTEEETERLAEGRKVRSMVYKMKNEETQTYVNDVMYNPFRRLYDIGFAFAEQTLKHPEKDMNKILEELNFPENEKILTLCYIREYATHCGLPSSHLDGSQQEARDPAKRQVKQQIVDFSSRFGTGKGIERDGGLVIVDGPFSELNNGLFTCISRLFEPDKRKTKVINIPEKTYQNMIDFCNKALHHIHVKKLKTGANVENDPYFNANSEAYQRTKQELVELRKTLAMEQAAKKTTLSFNRKGSDQFKAMKEAYEALHRRLEEHMQHPTGESFRELNRLTRDLTTKINAYLDYKKRQIRDDEVETKLKTMPDGTTEWVPTNSNTRNRMEFAENLLDRLRSLNTYVNANQPEPENELRI